MSGLQDKERWYAVQVKSQKEKSALTNLDRQGFVTFCPWQLRTISQSRPVKIVRKPFFSGYLFVRFNLYRDNWPKINNTFGVRRLVTVHAGQMPKPMPDEVIERLIASCDADMCIQSLGDIALGSTIRVVNGPFSDMLGQLQSVDSNERFTILLSMMSSELKVRLHRSDVIEA
ncbi:transcription termination/antitermination protein NusG [Alterisphingorhabdus coralli]|uniref:Transcription termination/antitermination NusG family protein n=1 Tax=Alterisphingorhabdus coralli TaxID=3071408 RepID=A0AA97I1J1_9SPHN|nr:transcription termination/antitermination NusG family protein [Parasphingorhabdus sp. SCSIO 66989]WOE74795.1 transcription termination/antitermination NusG family protein [Parasphingorhabdus sp. SCSIO 66989]